MTGARLAQRALDRPAPLRVDPQSPIGVANTDRPGLEINTVRSRQGAAALEVPGVIMAVETQGISGLACPEPLGVLPPTGLQQRASFHGKISVQKAA